MELCLVDRHYLAWPPVFPLVFQCLCALFATPKLGPALINTRLQLFDQCEVASLVSHFPWLSHHLPHLGANMLTSEEDEEDDIFVTSTRAAKPMAPAASLDEAGRNTLASSLSDVEMLALCKRAAA